MTKPAQPVTGTVVSTAELVARYAGGFNAVFATDHTVTSPFGAWLLLAVAAPATSGQTRVRLEAVLGCPAHDAARRAQALLEVPHQAVATATAVWAMSRVMNERFSAFGSELPAVIEQGEVPDQADADRWASAHTGGMIESFPVPMTGDVALVLATVVATDVSWVTPFRVVPADQLGGPFAKTITTALQAPDDHRQFLASTVSAGVVAVHGATAASGLRVYSVLAAADVPAAAVHEAAHQVAALIANAPTTAARVSLFDVADDGPAWSITETEQEMFGKPAQYETYETTMPAWSANAEHDIIGSPGFAELCDTFAAFLRPEFLPALFAANQVAVASYSRVGFEAAAATAVSMPAGSSARRATVTHRHAVIRFNRPYAVVAVAVAVADGYPGSSNNRVVHGEPEWADVPVFSAWVTRPDETDAET